MRGAGGGSGSAGGKDGLGDPLTIDLASCLPYTPWNGVFTDAIGAISAFWIDPSGIDALAFNALLAIFSSRIYGVLVISFMPSNSVILVISYSLHRCLSGAFATSYSIYAKVVFGVLFMTYTPLSNRCFLSFILVLLGISFYICVVKALNSSTYSSHKMPSM